jgi:hypothetical protein
VLVNYRRESSLPIFTTLLVSPPTIHRPLALNHCTVSRTLRKDAAFPTTLAGSLRDHDTANARARKRTQRQRHPPSTTSNRHKRHQRPAHLKTTHPEPPQALPRAESRILQRLEPRTSRSLTHALSFLFLFLFLFSISLVSSAHLSLFKITPQLPPKYLPIFTSRAAANTPDFLSFQIPSSTTA